MENIVIKEDYRLPSKGKVYKGVNVNPEVSITSMTTEHEMRRLSHTDTPYKNMAEIIDECLITKPGISSYDMCFGDYQYLLHKLRVVTYGPIYKIDTICPYCGTVNSKEINLDELEVKEYTEDLNNLFEIKLPKTGKTITLKMQTPRMLDKISQRVKEMNKKAPDMKGDPSILYTLESIIDKVDGELLDEVKLGNFVRKLPMMDTNYILKTAEKLNSKVGVNTEIENVCSVCGVDYKTTFPITPEFFGPSID